MRTLDDAGILLAVCTAKRADFAERTLENLGLRSCLQFVDGGDMGISKCQQLQALKLRKLIGNTTLMVGDRAVDLVAAHRNGLQSAGVLWGYGTRAELDEEKPRYLLSSPGELQTLCLPDKMRKNSTTGQGSEFHLR